MPTHIDVNISLSLDILHKSSSHLKEVIDHLLDGEYTHTVNEVGIEYFTADSPVNFVWDIRNSSGRLSFRSMSYHSIVFFVSYVIMKLRLENITFDAAPLKRNFLPENEYFSLISQHAFIREEISRMNSKLSEQAAQIRAIEKRFLTKLKDRNPEPINNIENLIYFVESKVKCGF